VQQTSISKSEVNEPFADGRACPTLCDLVKVYSRPSGSPLPLYHNVMQVYPVFRS